MRHARRSSAGALACLAALALAAVVVPAMHAEVHAREADADAEAQAPPAIPPHGPGPLIRVTHHVSVEIDRVAHRAADGTWHTHGPGHHHHDGDRPGDHGADAPEHLAFAIVPAVAPPLPPPFVAVVTIDPVAARAPLVGTRAIDALRSRGPPDAA